METLSILFNREGGAPSGVATFCRQIAEKDSCFCLIEPLSEFYVGSFHDNRIEVPAHIFCRGRKLADFLWEQLKDTFSTRPVVFYPNVGEECYLASILLTIQIEKEFRLRSAIVGICHSFDQNQFNHLRYFSPYLASIACVSSHISEELEGIRMTVPLFALDYPVADRFLKLGAARKWQTTLVSRSIRLIYIGRLDLKQKRVDRLIQLVQFLLKDTVEFSLTIVGDGPARIFLEKELLKPELVGRVVFTGAVSNDRIPEYLAQADVQLLVSDYEGNPISILEGMATGICPVVMDMKSGWNHIRHEENGFVVPAGDVRSLASVVKHLTGSMAVVKEVGEAGLESAKAFGVSRCREQIRRQTDIALKNSADFQNLPHTHTELCIRNCIEVIKSSGASQIGVYGAGHLGLALVATLLDEVENVTISIWVDGAKSKIGTKILKHEISSPETLKCKNLDLLVIASVDYAEEMLEVIEGFYSEAEKSLPNILSFASFSSELESPFE